jgi:hypothetical protein
MVGPRCKPLSTRSRWRAKRYFLTPLRRARNAEYYSFAMITMAAAYNRTINSSRLVSASWTSSRLCSLRDHDPGGRVVARSFPAADFAIDPCADQTCGRRRAQKQMIDAQAGITDKGISEVIPKSVDALIRM